MPYGGEQSQEEVEKIEKCVADLTAKGKDKESAIAICKAAIFKAREHKEFETQLLSIEQKGKVAEIYGVAVTTNPSNGQVFPSDILARDIKTLIGKPIVDWHTEYVNINGNRIEPERTNFATIGQVTDAWYNPTEKRAEFRGDIFNDAIAEQLRRKIIEKQAEVKTGKRGIFSVKFGHDYDLVNGLRQTKKAVFHHVGILTNPADGDTTLLEIKERIEAPLTTEKQTEVKKMEEVEKKLIETKEAEISKLQMELKEKENAISTLTEEKLKLTDKVGNLEKELTELKQAITEKTIEAELKELVSQGRLTPANVDTVNEIVSKMNSDERNKLYSTFEKKVEFREAGQVGIESKASKEDEISVELYGKPMAEMLKA
jgi:hypothetical protein